MKTRLFTSVIIAIVYVATILLAVLVHDIFFDIFAILVMLFTAMEMARAVSEKFGRPMYLLIMITIIGGYIAFFVVHKYVGNGRGGITAFFAFLVLMFIVCIVINMFSKTKTIRNVTSTMFVLIYPVTALIYTVALNYLVAPYRVSAILLLFLIATFTDTAAYLVGSFFKGPKLIPSVSPNKTISGAIGGLLGGVLAGAVVLLFSVLGFFNVGMISDSYGANIAHYLIMGFVGSAFVQIGDLIASYIKRACNIKDFGSLLPGHGGIMDRVDGLIVLGIFLYMYMAILSFF